jgi:hypothetical protein
MNRISLLKPWLRAGFVLSVAAAMVYAGSSVTGADADSTKKTDKPQTKVSGAKVSGEDLWQTHCNRCHPERYPTDRTASQWKTIMLHMRVRANLPASQAKVILKYLQAESGN